MVSYISFYVGNGVKKIEIENLNTKKTKERKRYDKINKNMIEIINLIKDDLKKINVVID